MADKKPLDNQRRKFLRTLVMGAGIVGAALLGIVPAIRNWVKRLRPPGALEEKDFLAACIKCGQCVQVCPVNAIKLADLDDGVGVGTPYIEARTQACDFSCDVVQCVLACPTGALTHEISYPHQVKMGVAKLVRPASCLAIQGLGFKGQARGSDFEGTLRYSEVDRWNPIRVSEHPYDLEMCDLCVRQCPIEIGITQYEANTSPMKNPDQKPPKHAIRMVEISSDDGSVRMKPEILDGCVGCGACEMICPVEPSCIEVDYSERGGAV